MPGGPPHLFPNSDSTGQTGTYARPRMQAGLVMYDTILFVSLWHDRGLLHGLAIADSWREQLRWSEFFVPVWHQPSELVQRVAAARQAAELSANYSVVPPASRPAV